MAKGRDKVGIWLNIQNYVEGEALNKLRATMVARVNDYGADPTDETLKVAGDATKAFHDAAMKYRKPQNKK